MKKVIKLSLILLFVLCLLPSSYSQNSKDCGIIIADEKQQTIIFNSDANTVSSFADSISNSYSKVIIHLGRSFVFRRGNIYTSKKSQQNLVLFCDILKRNNVKLYLWQLDSYGGSSFLKIYSQYKEIISENMDIIDSLNIQYDGIVVDLEWINNDEYDNSERFLELMKFFRERIGNKDLKYFASLIDNHEVNRKRGYSVSKLPEIQAFPIVMLYPSDGGFYFHRRKLKLHLDDARIKELKLFHKFNGWNVAVSFTADYYINYHGKAIKIDKKMLEKDSVLLNYFIVKSREYKNYKIHTYKSKNKTLLYDLKGNKFEFAENSVLYKFEMKKTILENNYYIYEYFNLKDYEKDISN